MPAMVHGQIDVSEIRADQCYAKWRPDVPCPNAYDAVIETLHAPGFMKCCALHRDSYLRTYGRHDVKVWTRAEWEASGREAELTAAIAAGGR